MFKSSFETISCSSFALLSIDSITKNMLSFKVSLFIAFFALLLLLVFGQVNMISEISVKTHELTPRIMGQRILNLEMVRWPTRTKSIAQVFLTKLAILVFSVPMQGDTTIGQPVEACAVGTRTPTTDITLGAATVIAVVDWYTFQSMLLP